MGCSSCATKTDESAPGCNNNGTCGTGGCNKLNVYNWLSDMEMPAGFKPFDVVEVRFKGSRKDFFRNPEQIPLKEGDVVAVEGNPGHDIGTVSMAGELVRLQLKKKGIPEDSKEFKTLYRQARPADIEKWESVRNLEVPTMYKARTIASALRLKMKLSDVEYQGDGKKATFFYTAEERVDFRELIKKLADEFKVRIEMRQIGMRQEASRLGGIGSCGRELCCSTWLTDFKAVSTGAARYQNLSLNPLKLAGQCGKLKCCLNYELDSYVDALRDIPDSGVRLETQKGYALHRKTDIFKRMMWFAFFDQTLPTSPSGEVIGADNWVALKVDRVKEIIDLNKQQQKPAELIEAEDDVPEEKPLDYADVVGQDSLTRMMDKKKKKKKKPNNKNRQGGSPDDRRQGGPRPQETQASRPAQQGDRNKQQGGRPAQGGKPQQQSGKPQQQRPPQQQQQQQRQQPQQNKPAENKPKPQQGSGQPQGGSGQPPSPNQPPRQGNFRQRQKPGGDNPNTGS